MSERAVRLYTPEWEMVLAKLGSGVEADAIREQLKTLDLVGVDRASLETLLSSSYLSESAFHDNEHEIENARIKARRALGPTRITSPLRVS